MLDECTKNCAVSTGKAVLAVFDETLQKEALTALTERETKLVAEGLIAKEMTTVMLSSGVKEVGGSATSVIVHNTLIHPFHIVAYTLAYSLSSLTHFNTRSHTPTYGQKKSLHWRMVKHCRMDFAYGRQVAPPPPTHHNSQ